MKNLTQEELELQKNRLEILKMSGRHDLPMANSPDKDTLYAWQYELSYYKKLKRRERVYMTGSMCGFLALVIVLLLHYEEIMDIIFQFVFK